MSVFQETKQNQQNLPQVKPKQRNSRKYARRFSRFGYLGTSCGAPIAKIKRLARQRSNHEGWYIRLIDEAYTSCRSHCCQGHEMKSILTGHKTRTTRDGRTVRCTVHGISRCTSCLKLWNRDTSATLNQWDLTSEILRACDNKARPWWLTKNEKQIARSSFRSLEVRTSG